MTLLDNWRKLGLKTKWSDVSIGTYLKYLSLPEPKTHAERLKYKTEVVRLFSKSAPNTTNEILAAYDVLEKFLLTEINTDPIEWFEFRGVTYYAPPTEETLNGTSKMHSLTVNKSLEAMRLQELQNRYDKVPEILSVLFRPKEYKRKWWQRKYTGKREEYDELKSVERAKLFKELPVSVAIPAYFFLSTHSVQELSRHLTGLNQTPRTPKSANTPTK